MSPQVSPMIRVEVGAATQVTFKLKVAGPRETITVWEAPRVGDPNPSSVSGPVEERAIKDLPLNGRRFTDLPLLMPGVTQDPRGQTGGSNGDLSYGGLRGYNTSFLVDGGDNRPPQPAPIRSIMSANGQQDVQTESASVGLISGLGPRLTSHQRVQFSQDREQSLPNFTGTRTSI
jgi:hypothetical protein